MFVQVREKIEESGRESRWEFGKTALFERTSHMAEVCQTLLSMLDRVQGFAQFLGPRLEAVTGNSQVKRCFQVIPSAASCL